MKLSAFCLWLTLLAIAPQLHASTAITINPATQNVPVGSHVQFDLAISGVNDGTTAALGSWDINLLFDPALLSFQSATFGNQLDVLGLGDVQSVFSPTAGTVNLYEIALDSVADLTSFQQNAFSLATLTFNAISGGTSAFDITVNALADANGTALTASVTSGNVTIAPAAVPAPAALWLFSSALAGYGLTGKRRRKREVA